MYGFRKSYNQGQDRFPERSFVFILEDKTNSPYKQGLQKEFPIQSENDRLFNAIREVIEERNGHGKANGSTDSDRSVECAVDIAQDRLQLQDEEVGAGAGAGRLYGICVTSSRLMNAPLPSDFCSDGCVR